jgi:uncharacterized protein with NRDE domain
MCTLALLYGFDRRWPVVVAANRDERMGRPSEGWALRESASGTRYAAPRDSLAGGTWIGVSAQCVFAGLTNYHAPQDWYPDPERRSRGELVELALAAPDAKEAGRALARLDPEKWNPFHLVVADTKSAFLYWYDGERHGMEPFVPGLHVVTESDREGNSPRAALVRARWPLDNPSPEWLQAVLTVHAVAVGPAATCIHQDPAYGTRSSAMLRLTGDLATSELFVCEVRPCLGPAEDRSDLFAALAPA